MTSEELQRAWDEMEAILIGAVADWSIKRQDYRDAFMELGSKGQVSEIVRKVAKLKRGVWDGYELFGEDPEQIAKEIIPHCMMLVYLLRLEEGQHHGNQLSLLAEYTK